MSNGNSNNSDSGNKKLSREDVAAILAENERLKAELASKPRKSGGGGNSKASYQRMKERMATDPEFAASQKAKRSLYQKAMQEKVKADPELREKKKAKAKAYRERKAAELAAFRAWKANQPDTAAAEG